MLRRLVKCTLGVLLLWSGGFAPALAQTAPTSCKLFGTEANCGGVGFNCDPFSATDVIVVAGAGVRVTGTAPEIGLITGEYFSEGQAKVRICVSRNGAFKCGTDLIDVKFGPLVCTGGGGGTPPPPMCHPSNPECVPMMKNLENARNPPP
jgi:hypothetical protein